jgi:hypothetical protein
MWGRVSDPSRPSKARQDLRPSTAASVSVRVESPWKSGALAPRKASKINQGFSPCRNQSSRVRSSLPRGKKLALPEDWTWSSFRHYLSGELQQTGSDRWKSNRNGQHETGRELGFF